VNDGHLADARLDAIERRLTALEARADRIGEEVASTLSRAIDDAQKKVASFDGAITFQRNHLD
jgi:hypothetical protein